MPTLSFLRDHGSLLLIGAAAASLVIFPIPLCFDCEGPNIFGQPWNIAHRNSTIFTAWLLLTPFFAAIFRAKRAWSIPIGITLADLALQHLEGVPWWDLKANEGPVILIIDPIIGFSALAVGIAVYSLAKIFKNRWIASA